MSTINQYAVACSQSGGWVHFCIKDQSIEDALSWVKANVQPIGVCVSFVPDVKDLLAEDPERFTEDESWIKQFRRRQQYLTS